MLHCVKKIGLSLQLQVRNKQCLQRTGRSLSSSHENHHANQWRGGSGAAGGQPY